MRSFASMPRRRISSYWKAWRKSCRELRHLIHRVKNDPSPHGQKWKDRMERHYTERLEELLKSEPEKYRSY